MGLSAIFDHIQVVAPRQAHDAFHIGWMAIQMNGYDGADIVLRESLKRGFHVIWVYGLSSRVNVNEDGMSSRKANRTNSGDRSMRGRNHRIPRAYATRAQSNLERIRSAAYTNAEADTDIPSKFRLQPADFCSEDVPAVFENRLNRLIDLRLVGQVVGERT
jgi:hypothetical protein